MNNLHLLDLWQASAAIAEGRVTSVALTESALRRIEELNGTLNCFIRVDATEALETAHERDRELAAGHSRGPLHGIPLAHKDMFDRAGHVSTGGTKILRDRVADETSTVLERLDAAGAVDLGGLHMSEFAAGPTGHNVHYGACRNAYDQDRVSGGSSSGSGTAVGARLVYGALGSDTGGSIRLPAAANGLVGLKATYGRVSRHGAVARSWSLDHIGPLARTVRDAALIFQAIAGPDPRDPTTAHQPPFTLPEFRADQDLKGLRVGVPGDEALASVHPEVRAALEESLRVLERLGATIKRTRLPDLKPLYSAAETIIKSEAAAMHRQWLASRPQDYASNVRVRIEAGLAITAAQYIDALRLRTHFTRDFLHNTMDGIDVLHLPTIPFPVPRIEDTDVEAATGERVLEVVSGMTQFTRPISLLGLPSLNLPCGFSSDGLPMGFQLIGRPFAEARLFVVGHAYQTATDFHRQAPPVAERTSRATAE
ncbi:amidase [Microvirga sp. KLBC 81]|uniref:amidase n=1 Tax=Microvirga sp. KLBC 81 TaxID=1862707 RepID=UPI001402DEEF|nr:amidase [Microvirga sp. KLBC 81]